jgi:hypothetical protein
LPTCYLNRPGTVNSSGGLSIHSISLDQYLCRAGPLILDTRDMGIICGLQIKSRREFWTGSGLYCQVTSYSLLQAS